MLINAWFLWGSDIREFTDNIKVIEQELEKDEESHIIVNIEKALMKLLGIGFKIQDVLDHVSKILDQPDTWAKNLCLAVASLLPFFSEIIVSSFTE